MTEIIGVRFRGGPKEYYFDPCGVTVAPGQYVIVETAAGQEYARCITGNHEVEDEEVVQPLRPLVRLATESDRRSWELNRAREKDAFAICRQKIASHGLDMKLVKVECNFDGSKIVFYFTSDSRVDFRALVRDLASEFRVRIELRQIGVRDEAKMLGGIGICGRPFCCAEFLDDFIPVSIKMAKTQNLSLNPAKISGACGRLMCCLKYEQGAYEDAVRRCPKQDSFVLTPDGPGNITTVDFLREQSVVRLDDAPEAPRRYHNSELNVLRSGKGSREGIEIPSERPERWQEPDAEAAEAALPVPIFLFESEAAEPAAEEAPAEKRRSRRGGRNRRRDGGKPAADAAPRSEKADKPEKPGKSAKAGKPEKAGKQEKTDKPEAADKSLKVKVEKQRRSRRRPSGGDKPPKADAAPKSDKPPRTDAAPKSGKPPKAGKPPRTDKAPKTDKPPRAERLPRPDGAEVRAEGEKPARRRHRGGRRGQSHRGGENVPET